MLLIFEDNQWNEYSHLSPYHVNEKRDETLDNAIVNRVSKTNKEFKKMTRVMLVDEITTHWVIENVDSEERGPLWYQTLHLIEPTELLKGYPLDNITVTQPVNPDEQHPRKTIKDVIDRLLKVAIPHKMLDIFTKETDSSRDLSTHILVEYNESMNELAPEDSFSEMTLFDAFVKIGLYFDSIPKLRFTGDNNEKLQLYFEPLDIKNKKSYIIDKPFNRNNSWSITNYADQIVSNSFNTLSSLPIAFPGSGPGTRISSEVTRNVFDLDYSGGYIQLPYKVKKISKMEIAVDFAFINSNWTDWSHFLYEYGEWQTLYPLSFSDDGNPNIPIHERQPYTMYYRMNDDKIYFGKNFLNFVEDTANKVNPILAWILDFLGWDMGKAGDILKYLLRYRFEMVPEVDLKIKVGQDRVENFSIIANQETTNVNIQALNNKLSFLLKRMKTGDYILSNNYKSINDIPEIGHLLNGKVITNFSYIRYPTYYHVSFQLNDEYTRRSEFIREKQEIRSWEIPADKANQRFVNYVDTMKLSTEPMLPNEYGNTSLSESRYMFPILRFFDKNHPYDLGYHKRLEAGLIALLDYSGKRPGDSYSILTQPLFIYTDDSLLVNIRPYDNTVFGHRLIKHGARYYPQGVTYTDPYGEVERINLYLTSDWYDLLDENQFENLPIAHPETTYQIITNREKAVNLRHLLILKDASEILNLTYQVNVISDDPNLVIRSDFFRYNGGMKGWLSDFYPYLYFFNRKIGKHEEVTPDMIIQEIRIDSASSPYGEKYHTTFEFDKSYVPSDTQYESFGIGIKHTNGNNDIMLVFNHEPQRFIHHLVSGQFTIYLAF